ncbi:MAG TPA: LysE family transporter [Vicinamibacterales bacterium]
MIPYIALGATYGFAAGAQPGQLQAYLINRAVANGWRRTWPAAFAPVISDAPIVALVLFALTRVAPVFLHALQVAGGAFLLYLAWRTAGSVRTASAPPAASATQTLGTAALLNLLNPNPYIAWSLVMGPLCLEAWRLAPSNAVLFVAVFYATMVAVSAGIVLVFATTRSLGARVSRICVAVSAVVLALFGAYQLWSGAAALLERARPAPRPELRLTFVPDPPRGPRASTHLRPSFDSPSTHLRHTSGVRSGGTITAAARRQRRGPDR